jgi:hypothetical protein
MSNIYYNDNVDATALDSDGITVLATNKCGSLRMEATDHFCVYINSLDTYTELPFRTGCREKLDT